MPKSNIFILPSYLEYKRVLLERYITFIIYIYNQFILNWLETEITNRGYSINKEVLKNYLIQFPFFTFQFIADDFTLSGMIRVSYTAISEICYNYLRQISEILESDIDNLWWDKISDTEIKVGQIIPKIFNMIPIVDDTNKGWDYCCPHDFVYKNNTESTYNRVKVMFADNGLTVFFNLTDE